MWDFSLVDPDNRRPVDFDLRRRALTADGRGQPKLWLIHRLLEHRRRHPGLYESNGYEPVRTEDDVVAFTRGDLAVVVPRRGTRDWREMRVGLPPGDWLDVLGDSPVGVLVRERS